MSYYPRVSASKSSANAFNPSDFITNDDRGSGVVSIDLSSYVSKSAPIFESNLYLKGNSLNFNGVEQKNPFDSTAELTLASTKLKTTALSYANNELTISGSVDLQPATIRFSDNSIPVSKVTNLSTILDGIQVNFDNIVENDVELALHADALAVHDTEIDLLKTHDTATDAAIDTANGLIAANGSTIQSHGDSIAVLNTAATDAATRLTANESQISANQSDIATLQTDVVTNAATADEYNAEWLAYAATNTAEKNVITSNISTNTTDIGSLVGRATALELEDIALNSLLSSAGASIIEHGDRITVNELALTDHETRVSAAEVTIQSNTADISTLAASTAANTVDISTLASTTAANSTLLSTHTDVILTKQPIINSTARLNAAFIGDGSVSNLGLSMLSDIGTTTTIQSQLDALTSSLSVLDGLQDLDIVNIPQIQSDISTLQSDFSTIQTDMTAFETATNSTLSTIGDDVVALETTQTSHGTSITALLASDTAHDSQIATNLASIGDLETAQTATATTVGNLVTSTAANSTAIGALVSADVIHDSQLGDLVTADLVLQANIDLKQDLIVLLDSAKIHDVALDDTLDNILGVIDSNITALSSSKQDVLSGANKLDSTFVDVTTTSLQYVDIIAPLQAQLTAITNSLSTLSGLQDGDVASFAAIQDNFDALDISKLDATVYTDTISPALASITSSISTLQGLQDGDIISFASINSSITNLTNTKQPLITSDAKLDSTLLNLSTTPLQYVDVSSSLAGSLAGLQTAVDGKQATLSGANKLPVSSVDLTGSSLANMDYGASVGGKFTSLDASISALSANDVSQSTLNTTYADALAANSTAISANSTAVGGLTTDVSGLTTDVSTLQTDVSGLTAYTAAQTTINSDVQTDLGTVASSIVDLETFETAQLVTNGTVASSIVDLQTDLGTKLEVAAYRPKDEFVDSGTFSANVLSFTYDTTTLYMNQLVSSAPFGLALTINSPQNGQTYTQRVLIDCLEFKGYINSLVINAESVELKYEDGDDNINLAPITGYSAIQQTIRMTYLNDAWLFAISSVKIFYNTTSNVLYDETPPNITLNEINGSAVISHEINTAYVDLGASAMDNIDGDISHLIVQTGFVDEAVLGTYSIVYTVEDSSGNETSMTRVVNVIDTENPIVTLNGDAEMSVNLGDVYTEAGATAADNSLETITVTITGSVDTNTLGDYVVTYSAYDSSNNFHSIGRLVHVVTPPLQLVYSNPTVDLFGLLLFQSKIAGQVYKTQADWTLSTGANTWGYGAYQVKVTTYRGDTTGGYYESLFSNQPYSTNSKWFEYRLYTHPFKINADTVAGNSTSQWDTSGNFVAYTVNKTSGGAVVTPDFTTPGGGCRIGEYTHVEFPFFVKISKFTVKNLFGYMPNRFQLVATNDINDWTVLGEILPMGSTGTFSLNLDLGAGHTGFKYFRFILYQCSSEKRAFFENIFIYGDVYK